MLQYRRNNVRHITEVLLLNVPLLHLVIRKEAEVAVDTKGGLNKIKITI